MRHAWNEALAAFDRELPLLNALRDEYYAYLRERFALARDRISRDFGGRACATISDDENEPSLGVELLGPLAEAELDFSIWSVATHGFETGRLRWGLYVPHALPNEMLQRQDIFRRAVEASGGLAREENSEAPVDVLDQEDDSTCAHWGGLDIGDPDLDERLSKLLKVAIPTVEAAASAVLDLRDPTLMWLRAQVVALRDGHTLPGFDHGRIWEGGPFAQVKVSGRGDAWVTALPDGTLGFHWQQNPKGADFDARVYAALVGARAPKNFPGIALLEASEARRLCSANDVTGLRDRVLDAFEKYRNVPL